MAPDPPSGTDGTNWAADSAHGLQGWLFVMHVWRFADVVRHAVGAEDRRVLLSCPGRRLLGSRLESVCLHLRAKRLPKSPIRLSLGFCGHRQTRLAVLQAQVLGTESGGLIWPLRRVANLKAMLELAHSLQEFVNRGVAYAAGLPETLNFAQEHAMVCPTVGRPEGVELARLDVTTNLLRPHAKDTGRLSEAYRVLNGRDHFPPPGGIRVADTNNCRPLTDTSARASLNQEEEIE